VSVFGVCARHRDPTRGVQAYYSYTPTPGVQPRRAEERRIEEEQQREAQSQEDQTPVFDGELTFEQQMLHDKRFTTCECYYAPCPTYDAE
jgi:hypothetical protein